METNSNDEIIKDNDKHDDLKLDEMNNSLH
jgi:hypothetical protein